jgi:hypothetical protein
LNEEFINNLNKFIMSNEIEVVRKYLQIKKSPGLDEFIAIFYWTFKQRCGTNASQTIPKIRRKGMIQNSFYEGRFP